MEHKARSLISAVGVFVGLLLPLRFPNYFWYILTATALGSALLVFWIFNEKPNLKRLKEDWFTIFFLIGLVTSSGIFAYLMPHPIFQALILGGIGFGVHFTYLAASRMKRGYTPSLFIRNVVSLTVILGVFFLVADVTKWVSIANANSSGAISLILVMATVFVMSEFLFEVQGVEKSILYSLVVSFALTQIVWLSSYWLVSYPESERITQLGVPLPAVLSSIYFYLFWGLTHHHLDESLTRKILLEYVIITGIFTLLVLGTAQWLPR